LDLANLRDQPDCESYRNHNQKLFRHLKVTPVFP